MTLIQAQLKDQIGTLAFDHYAKRNALGADLNFLSRAPLGIVKEMFFTADPISAERALRAGFVNEVIPAAQLEERTYAMARTIASRSAAAVAAAKQAIHELSDSVTIEPKHLREAPRSAPRRLFRTRVPRGHTGLPAEAPTGLRGRACSRRRTAQRDPRHPTDVEMSTIEGVHVRSYNRRGA